MNNLGKKICELRKANNMTQEDLAFALNVSAQAISKYENNICYPDITLLPQIAEIFKIDINYLFEFIKEDAPVENDGLKLVHSYKQNYCYSNASCLEIDNEIVKFKDGSIANLETKEIINKGQNQIKIVSNDFFTEKKEKTTFEMKLTDIKNFDFELEKETIDIIISNENKVFMEGNDLDEVLITNVNDTLKITQKERLNNNNKNDKKIKIYLKDQNLDSITIKVTGSALANFSNINTTVASFSIAGSLDVDLNKVNKLSFSNAGRCLLKAKEVINGEFRINGNSSINISSANTLNFDINGKVTATIDKVDNIVNNIRGKASISISKCNNIKTIISGKANVEVNELFDYGNAEFKIYGLGNVSLNSGFSDHLDILIAGNGNVNCEDLTTKTAKITIETIGNVLIGRVINESIEKILNKGKIEILNRGK